MRFNGKLTIPLVAACFCFVFGFCVCLLLRQKDLTQYNNTPIKLYNQSKPVVVDKACPVKGKASGTKKIYHLAGDQWYAKLKPTDCFANETEAQAAGFLKAKSLY
jgi:hypothetical protein